MAAILLEKSNLSRAMKSFVSCGLHCFTHPAIFIGVGIGIGIEKQSIANRFTKDPLSQSHRTLVRRLVVVV